MGKDEQRRKRFLLAIRVPENMREDKAWAVALAWSLIDGSSFPSTSSFVYRYEKTVREGLVYS